MFRHIRLDKDKLLMLLFLLIVLNLASLFASSEQPLTYKINVEQGHVFRFEEECAYWTTLSDYCVKDGYIYALFEGFGVVQIYDTQGKYLHSFAYKKINAGTSAIDVEDHDIYLTDQNYNFYVFREGEFLGYIEYSDYKTYIEQTEAFLSVKEKRQEEGETYYQKPLSVSIYSVNEKGRERCVVRVPWICFLVQRMVPFFLTVLLMFCWGIVYVYWKK